MKRLFILILLSAFAVIPALLAADISGVITISLLARR